MPDAPNQSDVDHQIEGPTDPQSLGDETEFNNLITEMVTDQAPRMFAIVIVYGDRIDAAITAWGISFDDNAYAITADGKNQYVLSAPENALQYVRLTPDTTPRLVWVTPSAATPPEPAE